MKFYTNYDRPDKKAFLEHNYGPTLVETAGYIPAKKQIENLLLAGERLQLARQELYDYNDDYDHIDDNMPDPTRIANYDLADASQELRALQERRKARLEARRREGELRIEAEKLKKAAEEAASAIKST